MLIIILKRYIFNKTLLKTSKLMFFINNLNKTIFYSVNSVKTLKTENRNHSFKLIE